MSGIQHTWILLPVRSLMSWVVIGMSLPSLGLMSSRVRWDCNSSHCENACKTGSPMPRTWKVLNRCLSILTGILKQENLISVSVLRGLKDCLSWRGLSDHSIQYLISVRDRNQRGEGTSSKDRIYQWQSGTTALKFSASPSSLPLLRKATLRFPI